MITSAEEFIKLRLSEKMEEYHRAAHDAAPEEVWLNIIQKYPKMRKWVAHNKTVKGKILELLAEDKDWRVRVQVAERRAAGEELLMKLSRDINSSVRLAVVQNPKVPYDILMKLSDDPSKDVREQVHDTLAYFKKKHKIL